MVLECNEGKFGTDCSRTCSCNVTNTATCNHVNGTCTCKSGFQGDFCTDDADECQNLTLCSAEGQRCINTHGSFHCGCQDGWTLNSEGNCIGKMKLQNGTISRLNFGLNQIQELITFQFFAFSLFP